jgi:holo-ACP synthase
MLASFLEYRDKKSKWIRALVSQTEHVIVSFRINAPGADKLTEEIKVLFDLGERELIKSLQKNKWKYTFFYLPHKTPEWIFLCEVEADEILVKKALIQLEEGHPCGRLFDFDVYDKEAVPLSRENLDFPQRTCFLCRENAFVCSRSQAHSNHEIQQFLTSKAAWAFDNMKED